MPSIVYYSDTFYSSHGGSTHANEFLRILKNSEVFELVIPFPESGVKRKNISNLSRFLPDFFRKILRLVLGNRKAYRGLHGLILNNRIDFVIFRHSVDSVFVKYLKRDFPDLVVIVEFNASPFFESYSRIPFLGFWKKREVSFLRKADLISVVSNFWASYISSFDDSLSSKVLINPNGVDTSFFHPYSVKEKLSLRDRFGIPSSKLVYGYVGGMEKFRKLPLVVSDFIDLVKEGYVDMFLIIVGVGEDVVEIERIRDSYSEIFDKYILLLPTWIDYSSVPDFLNLFDFAIFPFTAPYCSPLKIFEYAACNLPIIGPKIPSLEIGSGLELLTIQIDQHNRDFKNAIKLTYRNPDYYKSLSINNRETVLGNYTWKHNFSRIISNFV